MPDIQSLFKPFGYNVFHRILFEDRVWKRSLLDYNCNWCMYAKDPDCERYEEGCDHVETKRIQQQFYWDTLMKELPSNPDLQVYRLDFAGIKIAPCEKMYELVGVHILPIFNEPNDKPKKLFDYEFNHFLLPPEKGKSKGATKVADTEVDHLDDDLTGGVKKDVDFTAKCLEQWWEKTLRPSTKRLLIFTDGGAADFKNSKFENFLLTFQTRINESRDKADELRIEHHIFAPNHGQGICDAAHSHGVRRLKNWALENDKIIEKPHEIMQVFNTLKNHQAHVICNDQAFEDVQTFTGISGCLVFRYDSVNGKVKGYENSRSPTVLKSWVPNTKVARKK